MNQMFKVMWKIVQHLINCEIRRALKFSMIKKEMNIQCVFSYSMNFLSIWDGNFVYSENVWIHRSSRMPKRKIQIITSTKAIQRVIRHAIQIIRIYFYYTKFKKGKKKCIIFLMGTTYKVKSRCDKQFKCTHNSYSWN